MELSHRSGGYEEKTLQATDHYVNDNKPHTILISGSAVKWTLELDRRTTEYSKELESDVQLLLESTNLIYIGKSRCPV